MSEIIRYPYGKADEQSITAAATMAATITNSETYITISTLGAAGTLNLTLDTSVRTGDKLYVKSTSDGTARTLTFGTGFTAKALTGTISKTNLSTFVFDGTAFVNVANTLLN
jgi:hypothetical protein